MDDSTIPAVLETLRQELERLLTWVRSADELDLGTAEQTVRDGVLALGGHLLTAGLAARGPGKTGPRRACPCGGEATFEGYRPKGVQTLVGWIDLHRAYYWCAGCGQGHCPLDGALGVRRDSHSPEVRSLASQFGAWLPFAPAAAILHAAAGVHLSASTVRTVTEGEGARQDQTVVAAVAQAWATGLPVAAGPPPDRLYVAMDGVRILSTDGAGREVKVGMVVPVQQTANGERRGSARYAASLEPAETFGRRLALVAHQQGVEQAPAVAVLGDGAAWIWNLAAEHFPHAVPIVDWFHASERIWTLGKALYGEETAATTTWVARQLARLAAGEVRALVAAWHALDCAGAAATVRDEQVTYFTNQAPRMAYAQYRAAGWDIGSGMIESGCKYVIGAREKGPGMRWTEHGAQTVAQLRTLAVTHRWDDLGLAA